MLRQTVGTGDVKELTCTSHGCADVAVVGRFHWSRRSRRYFGRARPLPPLTAKHIAIDGKTLRGSRRHDATALHVVSAFATELSVVIGDLVVPPDQNEITAALALLRSLPLDGTVITGDAIFCQREICRHIRDNRGHYLFTVKQNQPELHAAIAESFGDLSPLGRADASRKSAA